VLLVPLLVCLLLLLPLLPAREWAQLLLSMVSALRCEVPPGSLHALNQPLRQVLLPRRVCCCGCCQRTRLCVLTLALGGLYRGLHGGAQGLLAWRYRLRVSLSILGAAVPSCCCTACRLLLRT